MSESTIVLVFPATDHDAKVALVAAQEGRDFTYAVKVVTALVRTESAPPGVHESNVTASARILMEDNACVTSWVLDGDVPQMRVLSWVEVWQHGGEGPFSWPGFQRSVRPVSFQGPEIV